MAKKEKSKQKVYLKWIFWGIAIILILLLIFGSPKHMKLEGFKDDLNYTTARLKIISNESYTYNPEGEFLEIKQMEEEINKIEFDMKEVLGKDNSSFDAEMALFYLDNTYDWIWLAKVNVAANYIRQNDVEVNPELVEMVLGDWEWQYLIDNKYL